MPDRFFYQREQLVEEDGGPVVETPYCVYDVYRGSEYGQHLATCGAAHIAETIVAALNAMTPPAKPKVSLGIFG